ncbi:hypothetical protein ES703_71563 [subsurface metagenome]
MPAAAGKEMIMNQHELTTALLSLFAEERKSLISPTRGIVFRGGGFAMEPAEEFEAGDIVIIPPSLVTTDAPSQGYIQGCIAKCWPQIEEQIK